MGLHRDSNPGPPAKAILENRGLQPDDVEVIGDDAIGAEVKNDSGVDDCDLTPVTGRGSDIHSWAPAWLALLVHSEFLAIRRTVASEIVFWLLCVIQICGLILAKLSGSYMVTGVKQSTCEYKVTVTLQSKFPQAEYHNATSKAAATVTNRLPTLVPVVESLTSQAASLPLCLVARPYLLALGRRILVDDPRTKLRPRGIHAFELGGSHLDPGDAHGKFVPIAVALQALEARALGLGEDVAHVEARVLTYW
ncbi:hypothetical protein CCMA1212_007737 [Trichoderma ghanense]|uniref:Uncharacterized protein n=1 Tax=Trichoderma ghanense TaxID=65468 RepID=A0ABY2GYE1_9HYPO